MKIFKINRMLIDNFKNIKHIEITLNGKNADITGENGTGKTTIFDAYVWAITGKLSNGSAAEDSIKRFGENGVTPLDGGLIHAVEIEFGTDNNIVTIRREFTEQYTTPSCRSISGSKEKHGTATKVFKGHTTNFFINGVPYQKKDFEAFMNSFAPLSAFSILSMPTYFCQLMAWKERRKLLMEICGAVTDEDVINTEEKLQPLAEFLKDLTVDDFIKTLKANIKKYGEELKTIPARIDELSKQIVDVGGNKDELLNKIQELQKKRSRIEEFLKDLQKQPHIDFTSPRAELSQIIFEIENLETVISESSSKIARINEQLKSLKGEYIELEKSKPGLCPTCGQRMPLEKFIETRNKRAQFIANEVKPLKEIRQRQTTLIENWQTDLKKFQERAAELQKKINTSEDQNVKIDVNQEKINQSYKQIEELNNSINEVKDKIRIIDHQKQIKQRIEELETRETELNEVIAEFEKRLYLAEIFIRQKVKLIEKNINSNFKFVKFKMFDTQLNGSITECCEPLIDDVPYNDGLNRGSKMKAALDIISTLSNFYSIELPVFIDDAESYTTDSLINITNQVIKLIVAEGFKELKIVVNQG